MFDKFKRRMRYTFVERKTEKFTNKNVQISKTRRRGCSYEIELVSSASNHPHLFFPARSDFVRDFFLGMF